MKISFAIIAIVDSLLFHRFVEFGSARLFRLRGEKEILPYA